MVPVVPSTLVVHECRGLKKRDNEIGERSIRIERLPDDHPSECGWEVTVLHPKAIQHTEGSVGRPTSVQEPEIVHRGNDERHAKYVYAQYAKVLGGKAPSDFDAAPSPRDDAKRMASLEREVDELRAIVDSLRPKK